jgi:hypothetical protein
LKVEKREKVAVACKAKRDTEAYATKKKKRRQDAGATNMGLKQNCAPASAGAQF